MDDVSQHREIITSFEKWMITITVMLAAVIEVLDMTIVNVSLDQMMGTFEATTEQITWVLTAYLVSSAVVMPLTGRIVQRFGRKRILLINITGFLLTSMLCGISNNLTEIVIFRTLQGIFGAALVPISQFVLRDTFTREEQGVAMAIWGLGIMTAPVLGPTIGGFITANLNWRWIFYINVPICIVCFLLATTFIRESKQERIPIDWLGLILLILGVGCFQTFLDRGNQADWFSSNSIVILAIVSAIALLIFIARGIKIGDRNIVHLNLFKERNFLAATLILTFYAMFIFGIMALQPIMLENLMGYPSNVAGIVMGPRGLASAVAMISVGIFIKRVNLRILVILGILSTTAGTLMMSHYNLNAGMWQLISPTLFQGFGMGLVMVPVSATAFDYLAKKDIAEASGLFSFGRSIGSSIGISLLSTIVTRQGQTNWTQLSHFISTTNPNFLHWLAVQGLSIHDTSAIQMAVNIMMQQGEMIAFLDAYHLSACSLLFVILLVFMMKKRRADSAGFSEGAH